MTLDKDFVIPPRGYAWLTRYNARLVYYNSIITMYFLVVRVLQIAFQLSVLSCTPSLLPISLMIKWPLT